MYRHYYKSFFTAMLAGIIILLGQSSEAAVNITAVTITEDQLNIAYPQLEELADAQIAKKINDDIKFNANKFINECRESDYINEGMMKYTIHYIDDNKISFELIRYTYSGGAHGSTFIKGYTYDLHTGKIIPLTKQYDFRPSEINKQIFAYAKANDVFLFSDFQGISLYPSNYYLNEAGIPVILFQQYEIAPYSSGVLRVTMY